MKKRIFLYCLRGDLDGKGFIEIFLKEENQVKAFAAEKYDYVANKELYRCTLVKKF